jgi:hypothetical protein
MSSFNLSGHYVNGVRQVTPDFEFGYINVPPCEYAGEYIPNKIIYQHRIQSARKNLEKKRKEEEEEEEEEEESFRGQTDEKQRVRDGCPFSPFY